MKPPAYLLNAARGRVVDEPVLVDALALRQIRVPRSTSRSRSRCPRPRRCGHGERAHHAAYGSPLGGRCAPDHAGESRAARARRDRAAEPGGPPCYSARRTCGIFFTMKRQVCSTSSSVNTASP
ncbi:MAG TPA: hypothetical protein VG425_09980 [Casimicrobiaceae bacterium]|nr:hypothetical protein [Casimicrobiaceae bacterium]